MGRPDHRGWPEPTQYPPFGSLARVRLADGSSYEGIVGEFRRGAVQIGGLLVPLTGAPRWSVLAPAHPCAWWLARLGIAGWARHGIEARKVREEIGRDRAATRDG